MRVIALDARTGEVLDWEVPAIRVSLTRSLSLACMVGVTVPAEYHANVDEDGHPWLLRRGTILVVEEDSGRLTPALMNDESLADDLQVDGLGLSTLSNGEPWQGAPESWSSVDTLALWRLVWGRIISRPGMPGLTITGDATSGVNVGRAPSAEWSRVLAEIAAAQKVIDARDARGEHWEREMTRLAQVMAKEGGRKGIGEVVTSSEVPQSNDGATYKMVILTNTDGKATRVYHWRWTGNGIGEWYYRNTTTSNRAADDWIAAKNTRDNSRNWFASRQTFIDEKKAWQDANPDQAPEVYTLSWWANRDLSADLEALRDLGGFDWYETAHWGDNDRLVPAIHVTKNAGALRDDLHFELGVNIHSHPELHRGEVATHVTVMGAGEGQSTLMADRAWNHPRLVRTSRTVSDSSLGTRQLVDRAADRELATARDAMAWRFTGLRITDSDAAPIDRIDIGDRIDIRGEISDGTDLYQRVRIREITRTWDGSNPGDSIEIEVEPA